MLIVFMFCPNVFEVIAETMTTLKKINSFTDVLLITSGSSSTHMSAISNKLIRALKKNKVEIINLEGKNSADWVLLDLGDIVINVMSISAREYYDLESLWDNSLA